MCFLVPQSSTGLPDNHLHVIGTSSSFQAHEKTRVPSAYYNRFINWERIFFSPRYILSSLFLLLSTFSYFAQQSCSLLSLCFLSIRVSPRLRALSFSKNRSAIMTRGSQRDRDRERAQSRTGGKGKQKDDGLTPEQRRERDAKALQEKAAKKAAQGAGGNNAGGSKK